MKVLCKKHAVCYGGMPRLRDPPGPTVALEPEEKDDEKAAGASIPAGISVLSEDPAVMNSEEGLKVGWGEGLGIRRTKEKEASCSLIGFGFCFPTYMKFTLSSSLPPLSNPH